MAYPLLLSLTTVALLALSSCGSSGSSVRPAEPSTVAPAASSEGSSAEAPSDFVVHDHGRFTEGWAMSFLPGTDYLLISERVGALQLRDQASGEVREVEGAPPVMHESQAGMHDVVPGPNFEEDGVVYLSWVAEGPDRQNHGVVGRAVLDTEAAALQDLEVIWEQDPSTGGAHYSLRMLFHEDHLFLASGDRAAFDPAQDVTSNLGKVLRLTPEGQPAPGNPFAGQGGRSDEVWTMGHRNPLGIDVDSTGQIWVSEMGPEGGDELNAIVEGENYGWPQASMGDHYDGEAIAEHSAGDGFVEPAEYWAPSISPGSLEIYEGELFAGWRDSALLGGLSGQTLVRVELDGTAAENVARWDMGERIREVEEGPDGSIWLLEDGRGGRLLQLRPE